MQDHYYDIRPKFIFLSNPLARLSVGEKTPDFTVVPQGDKEEENSLGDIVKEPWFIATIGVFVWLILLVIVVFICCRKRKKHHQFRGSSSTYESRGRFF